MVLRYEDARRSAVAQKVADLSEAIDATIRAAMRRNQEVIEHHLCEVTVDTPENEITGEVGTEIQRLYTEAGWDVEIQYPSICLSGRVILRPA